MKVLAVLVGLVAFCAMCQARPKRINVDTVPELDLDKYLGRWYQTWGNRFGWLSYGDDAVCITATYTLRDPSTVSVLNHNRVSTGNGEERSIGGTATRTEEPGKFILQLDGVPFEGSYWVIQLGPPEGPDGQYDYAVVTSEDFLTLFVLTRNVDKFKEVYEEDVLAFLESAGFTDYWTRPVPSYHFDNCQYPPVPSA